MTNLAGRTIQDQRIWSTYLLWARQAVDPTSIANGTLEIARQGARLTTRQQRALQAILFSAFALEFRIKRIFEELGIAFRHRDTLGRLIEIFRRRVEAASRLGGTGPVTLPAAWLRLEPRLRKLSGLRNRIAHADYREVQRILSRRPSAVARRSFNAVVEFMILTNPSIGYDSDAKATRNRLRTLKVSSR